MISQITFSPRLFGLAHPKVNITHIHGYSNTYTRAQTQNFYLGNIFLEKRIGEVLPVPLSLVSGLRTLPAFFPSAAFHALNLRWAANGGAKEVNAICSPACIYGISGLGRFLDVRLARGRRYNSFNDVAEEARLFIVARGVLREINF